MMTYKPSKLGQTNLVFGMWSEFISRSVRAGLQISTCSSGTMVNTQTHIQLWPVALLTQPAELKTRLTRNISPRVACMYIKPSEVAHYITCRW